jgi:hypothetical protein
MRRFLVVLLLALVAGAMPVAIALTIDNGSRLDHQRAKASGAPATTSSTSWRDLPGLGNMLICARGRVAAIVSVDVTGAPVALRVSLDAGPTLRPSSAKFDPSAFSTSFSFTFTAVVGPFEGLDDHSFDVQWRSLTGAPVTFRRGDVDLLFREGDCTL